MYSDSTKNKVNSMIGDNIFLSKKILRENIKINHLLSGYLKKNYPLIKIGNIEGFIINPRSFQDFVSEDDYRTLFYRTEEILVYDEYEEEEHNEDYTYGFSLERSRGSCGVSELYNVGFFSDNPDEMVETDHFNRKGQNLMEAIIGVYKALQHQDRGCIIGTDGENYNINNTQISEYLNTTAVMFGLFSILKSIDQLGQVRQIKTHKPTMGVQYFYNPNTDTNSRTIVLHYRNPRNYNKNKRPRVYR